MVCFFFQIAFYQPTTTWNFTFPWHCLSFSLLNCLHLAQFQSYSWWMDRFLFYLHSIWIDQFLIRFVYLYCLSSLHKEAFQLGVKLLEFHYTYQQSDQDFLPMFYKYQLFHKVYQPFKELCGLKVSNTWFLKVIKQAKDQSSHLRIHHHLPLEEHLMLIRTYQVFHQCFLQEYFPRPVSFDFHILKGYCKVKCIVYVHLWTLLSLE